jgi:hypothetical protein
MISVNRRTFLQLTGGAGLALAVAPVEVSAANTARWIDRQAVVRRHNPHFTKFSPFAALSLGNGEFAFTADITGLQTFTAECDKDFPLCTASHWGWHSTPMSAGLRREDFRYQEINTYGRPVKYATDDSGQKELFNWLRENPHRLHLGRIGFDLRRADGSRATPADLKNIRQTLDLWRGILESQFEFAGQPVRVRTCCHPELDCIAVRIESPLLANGRLPVLLEFPYGSSAVNMADWAQPNRHTTFCQKRSNHRADFGRTLDDTPYQVRLSWSKDAELRQRGAHVFALQVGKGQSLEFVCAFSPKPLPSSLPTFAHTASASAKHWERFWTSGGAIDLGGSTDPRAEELERRIVLSQYQTAIHCAGSLPSAETGLLCNSWYGKFHLEMHWWHSVHFAAWGRFPLFERTLGYYPRILPVAREIAQRQGYRGARWPKMVGPDGRDAPSKVGPLLIWQQPHPIYYAELCYRERPTRKTLEQWHEVVFESAEFMASYAVLDSARDQFVLGPPMKTVSENNDTLTTRNPTFELAYWRFGLRVAQAWRERLGLPREPRWDSVLQKPAPLPTQDGCYMMQEGLTDTFTKWNWEHPALMGAFGVQPGDGVDPATMRRTVRCVMKTWQWERTWGWDFPMTAMCAARSAEPELAVDALMIQAAKNRYHPNGHNYQRPGLTAYLPGNGGLLAAVAMMAAGWTNGPSIVAPGFPKNGKWSVKHEGLKRWL